eukprot:90484_1
MINVFFPRISFNKPFFLINDDINKFAEYFIAMNECVNEFAESNIFPFQIDMLIIPKKVEKDKQWDSDTSSDAETDCDNEKDVFENIQQRLMKHKYKYNKTQIYNNDIPFIKRVLHRLIRQRISLQTSNQRIIVYINRRNVNVMIYVVQAPHSKFPTYYSALTGFEASIKCMLPPMLDENKYNSHGCLNDLNGFTFSWQVEKKDLIRCYWFASFGGTRFFPSDAIYLWPIYFKNGKKIQETLSIYLKLKQMEQVKDDGFVSWYENTTKSKLLTVE